MQKFGSGGRDSFLSIIHLRPTGYELIPTSELLPNLDMALLARYVKPEEQFDAVMTFRDSIRTST